MMTRILLLIAVLLLTGCIVAPLPHVSRSSPVLNGRVVDAQTGKPVEGAVVQAITYESGDERHASTHQEPILGTHAKTQIDGQFHLTADYNFHLLWYANPSFQFHLPYGTYWLGELSIKHDGYHPLWFTAKDKSHPDIGDLQLVPIKFVP